MHALRPRWWRSVLRIALSGIALVVVARVASTIGLRWCCGDSQAASDDAAAALDGACAEGALPVLVIAAVTLGLVAAYAVYRAMKPPSE